MTTDSQPDLLAPPQSACPEGGLDLSVPESLRLRCQADYGTSSGREVGNTRFGVTLMAPRASSDAAIVLRVKGGLLGLG
jgi:hypothetical protein